MVYILLALCSCTIKWFHSFSNYAAIKCLIFLHLTFPQRFVIPSCRSAKPYRNIMQISTTITLLEPICECLLFFRDVVRWPFLTCSVQSLCVTSLVYEYFQFSRLPTAHYRPRRFLNPGIHFQQDILFLKSF